VRESSGLPVGAFGLIPDPRQAEAVVADVVLLARAALREPSWPLRAAHELGVPASAMPYPEQYLRGVWRRVRAAAAGEHAPRRVRRSAGFRSRARPAAGLTAGADPTSSGPR
jgi:hypothetical protein